MWIHLFCADTYRSCGIHVNGQKRFPKLQKPPNSLMDCRLLFFIPALVCFGILNPHQCDHNSKLPKKYKSSYADSPFCCAAGISAVGPTERAAWRPSSVTSAAPAVTSCQRC